MSASRSSTNDPSARGPDPGGRQRRRSRGLLVALLAGLAAFALPASSAFGEGSVDQNTGPETTVRQSIMMSGNPATIFGSDNPYTTLYVYAQAGETIQLGSSAVGLGAGNILVYQPGTQLERLEFPEDPAFGSDIFDCLTDAPAGAGEIAQGPAGRAQELAGPEASPDANPATWVPCEFVAPASGIYPVIMMPQNPAVNGSGGTIAIPTQTDTSVIPIWDITVRAGGTVQPGRAFAYNYKFATTGGAGNAADLEAFVYTKTGYEYHETFTSQAGANWQFISDDRGIVDVATGERTFASFACGDGSNTAACQFFDAGFGPPERRYPLFLNRADPIVISGAGGLAETRGYSTTPIAPATQPLAGATFTGSGGQSGATSRGSGGTISFTSPQAMEGLEYAIEIDTNGNGTFGDAPDFVDSTGELSATGSNAFAWNGRDGQSSVPACGDYQYRVRATLAEVHFPAFDVENSGGTHIERLSLPTDPALGDRFAASYNDIDPYKNIDVLPLTTPTVVTDGNSSAAGFHAWDQASGDTDYIDTWAQLPEVQTTGTLRLLCADPQVIKTVEPAAVVPGEDATFKLEVKNNGPDAATDVSVVDDLPDSVQFKSASQGCTEAGSVVTCSLASLAPGATHTFEIVVAVPSSLDECIENSATVTNTTFDTNLANNTSADCFKINRRSDLSIAKDPSSATVASGGQVMYTLVVRNHGPSDDPGVEVSDPMAAGLSLVSAQPAQGTCTTTNNTVDCELGTLKDGGSTQILVTANVTAPAGSCGPNAINNTATVEGANTDPTPDNNKDSAQICTDPPTDPQFDLVVTKRANDTRLLVGQRVRYTVTVRNDGPDAAPGATVKDTINAPVSVVSVKASQGSCTKRIPMTCELGTIAAGDTVTIRIVAKHREATGCSPRQRQAASATGDGTDTNPANNMDTVDVCVREIPRLEITKVANRSVVQGGETFSYRIRVRNPSKGEATPVKVCDRLPSGLRYVSSKPSAKRQGSRQHCWTIKRLGAGKSKTFRVTVRAARGANGRKINTATASSPDVRQRARARDPVDVRGIQTPLTG